MKKYTVKLVREFEVEIKAVSIDAAQALAERITMQFPANTSKVLSIIEEGAQVEVVAELDNNGRTTPPRGGRPNGGGSPGTPVVKTEELVDQIAAAA